jgi:tricorn protease
VPTSTRVSYEQHQVWDQVLVEGWRYLREYFYDPTMNNTDWPAVLARYRSRIPQIGTKDEFGRLYREMLGELGRSHLGYFAFGTHREAPPEITASFGVLLSDDYPGPGWHVRRVLRDGPADIGGSRLYSGDVIIAINDKTIEASASRDQLLRNLHDFPVMLRVKSGAAAKEAIKLDDPEAEITDERDVPIQPMPAAGLYTLQYRDWVEQNRAKVTELSANRIGYQHIESMNLESLIRFRSELLTDSYDKDALIIDVRFNGGGFTSVAVLEVLKRQAAYKRFRRETGEYSYARQQVWDGPVVLLINAHSFSNAEILAHVFKDLNIATLIGETTGGNVISTGGVQLMDGSFVRLPSTGNARLDGSDMEGQGAVPDIAVDIDPYLLTLGRDNQIETAVSFLLEQLGS